MCGTRRRDVAGVDDVIDQQKSFQAGKGQETYKAKPVRSSMAAMVGKESRRRFRRPKVSIVQIAGPANTKFTAPEGAVRNGRQVKRR